MKLLWASRRSYDAAVAFGDDRATWLNSILEGERRHASEERARLTALLEAERARTDRLIGLLFDVLRLDPTATEITT